MLELSSIMTTFREVICRGSCCHSNSQCSMCVQQQGSVDVPRYLPVRLVPFCLCVGFSQPPILASVQSVVHRSCYKSALRIHVFWRIWEYLKSQHGLPSLISLSTIEVISPEPFQRTPCIASSSTMCKLLHHLSRYCVALNLIFPAFTLSPTFSNFRSLLQQMEPTPSQVRNHYSQKNQKAHLERALAFKKAANLHCPSNVCLSIICLPASCCGWLISPISLINQDDETNQEICDDDSEEAGESTSSSDIEEDHLDHQQEVLHLGQAGWDKSLRTIRVPLPKIQSCADTVIARPPLPNSQNLPVAMAPLLLKRQK